MINNSGSEFLRMYCNNFNQVATIESNNHILVYLTSVWSFSRMYGTMLAQGRQLPEALPTSHAVEIPLIRVSGEVAHQSVLMLELTATCCYNGKMKEKMFDY